MVDERLVSGEISDISGVKGGRRAKEIGGRGVGSGQDRQRYIARQMVLELLPKTTLVSQEASSFRV